MSLISQLGHKVDEDGRESMSNMMKDLKQSIPKEVKEKGLHFIEGKSVCHLNVISFFLAMLFDHTLESYFMVLSNRKYIV